MAVKILTQDPDSGVYQWVNVSGSGGSGGGSLDELEVDFTDTNNISNYTGDKSLVVTTPQTGTKRLNIQYDGSVGANAYGRKYVQSSEPISPNNGDIWYDTSGDAAAFGITRYATVYDSKDGGVGAGSPPNTAYHDRTLNKKDDPYDLITLDSGNVYFSLVAGNYRINWRAPGNSTTGFRSKLVYANNSAFVSPSEVLGESGISNTSGWEPNEYNCGTAIISISETHYFKIQQALNQVGTWGNACSVGGEEIYTQVFVEDLATAVKNTSNNYVPGTSRIATVKDVKPYDVNGGEFVGSKWIVRDLNTLNDPQGIGFGVNGNVVTVPAGTYKIKWRAPAYHCDRHTSRLAYSSSFVVNDDNKLTTGVSYITGETSLSNADGNSFSYSQGIISSLTLTSTTYIQVQHYSANGSPGAPSTGLGVCSNLNSADSDVTSEIDSVYTTLDIEDLKTAVKNAGDDYVSGISRRAKVEDIGTQWDSAGGQFPAASWTTRSLTNVTDPKGIGIILNTESSTNNYIEVPAGTYSFRWSAPAMNVDRHVARLTYSDNFEFSGSNTFDLYGDVAFSENDADNNPNFTSFAQTRSTGFAPSLTFSAKTYIRVQHYSDTGNNSADDAMGVSSPTNNCLPIFTTIEIEDLKTAVKDSPGAADVPVGGIIMWSGTKTALDALPNWVLCDNSAAAVSAGAPDLRDKFVIGAHSYSDEGDGKWETNVTGSGTQSGGYKDAVVVEHDHDIGNWGMSFGGSSGATVFRSDASGTNTESIQKEGEDGTNKNLPPYFALAYIMKIF